MLMGARTTHCRASLATALTAAVLVTHVQGLGKYNPCSTPGPATSGRGFYVGIALWPGGSVEDWLPAYDSTTGEWGLNPCNVTADFNNTGLTPSQYLAQNGVVVAAFEVQIDTLMSLRINASDIARLFGSINTGRSSEVISAVVFRAGYRSEAVYVRSEDAVLSHGLGSVQTLALSAAFSVGQLTALQWNDLTCNACGGLVSQRCITTATSQPQHSCSTNETACASQDCSLSLYLGFSGTDRNSVALQTGFELARVNQYSASTLYNDIVAQVDSVVSGAQTGDVGQIPNSPDAGTGSAS